MIRGVVKSAQIIYTWQIRSLLRSCFTDSSRAMPYALCARNLELVHIFIPLNDSWNSWVFIETQLHRRCRTITYQTLLHRYTSRNIGWMFFVLLRKWNFAWVLNPLLSTIIFLWDTLLSNYYHMLNSYWWYDGFIRPFRDR